MSNGVTKAGRTSDGTASVSALPQGKNYLFVIGIDKYQKHRNLANPVLDAEAFIKLVTEKYQFSNQESQLITLFDEKATQANIYNRLAFLADRVTNQDCLVIYFSGHGEYKKKLSQGYWIPHDGDPDNAYGSYISFKNFISFIEAIDSFHTFIIADSCYAGSLFTARSATSDVMTRYESIPSRWLLTAGRLEEVPDGQPNKHSPFAKSLLTWLGNNNNPRFSVADLCRKVIHSIDSMGSDQTPQGESLRIPGNQGGEFMFRLKEYADKVIEEEVVLEDHGTDRGGKDVPPQTDLEPPSSVGDPVIHNLSDLKTKLRGHLASDEFKKTFELFDKFLRDSSSSANLIISLQGQYNGMIRQQRAGTVNDSFAMQTFNRIRIALTELTNDLEEEDINADAYERDGRQEASVEDLKHRIEDLQKEVDKSLDAVNAPQQDFASRLTDLERQGIQSQLNILQKKLNFFLERQAVISDPSQRFTLEMQIEETQQQINEAKAKLGI